MKSPIKYLALLPLAILFCSVPSFAQSNYRPGLIVDLRGDTTHGFIDYQEWDNNPDAIDFKTDLSEKQSKRYGTNDITYFRVDKLEAFIKYDGPISTDAVDAGRVNNGRDTSSKIVTVFLKVLEKGDRLALYSYKDVLKIRYFIAEAPSYAPRELIYRIYNDPNANTLNGTVTEYTYRKQLSAAALKYNELNDNLINYIGKAEYNDDILDVVSKINHISKAEYEKNHVSGSSFSLFAGLGLNMTTTTPGPSGPFYEAGARQYTSYFPAVYFGANFFVNPSTRRLFFTVELLASQSNLREKYTSQVYPQVPNEAMYNAVVFSGSLQVNYNFYNGQKFKIFGGAGIFASSSSFSNTYIGAQNHNNSTVDLNATEPWLFNGFNDAFLFKVGVQFSKHLQVFGEYQSSIAVTSSNPYYDLSSTSKQIALIYLFK